MLEIRMLGKFDVQLDGESVDIQSRPAQSLLAYLVLNAGTSYRREKLAGQFWPDSNEQNTRRYLRQALWQLRKVIGQDYINADNLNIEFDVNSAYWLDASKLEQQAAQDSPSDELIAVVSVYSGELLPGFYENWAVLERERLQSVFDQKMHLTLDRLAKEQRWTDILEWGERWVSLGHAPEPAYRALMVAHGGSGDQAGVAAAYQRCIDKLANDLGVEPSYETTALYERLTKGEAQPTISSKRWDILTIGRKRASTVVSPLDRMAHGRLVGRENELQTLRSIWDRALHGEGQLVMISGEPGIGKSRLAAELVNLVEDSGCQTFMGECYADGGAPYAPFAQIFRQSLHNSSGIDLDLPPFVLADLIKLAPDLRLSYPDIPPNAALEPQSEQQRMFENVVAWCSMLIEQAPLVLAFDDIHWADSGTLALLRHLVRRMRRQPLLIVGTYREIEMEEARPFQRVFQDLNRERQMVRLKLGRLTREQTGELLAATFDTASTPDFLDSVYREAEGNPFFVEEV